MKEKVEFMKIIEPMELQVLLTQTELSTLNLFCLLLNYLKLVVN